MTRWLTPHVYTTASPKEKWEQVQRIVAIFPDQAQAKRIFVHLGGPPEGSIAAGGPFLRTLQQRLSDYVIPMVSASSCECSTSDDWCSWHGHGTVCKGPGSSPYVPKCSSTSGCGWWGSYECNGMCCSGEGAVCL